MKAVIINVGTELLMGSTLNTHAQYLSMKLSEIGIPVYAQAVVGDNANRLKALMQFYYETADVIILTGGLGPTDDDLTKETVAEVFRLELQRDEKSYEELVDKFEKFGRPMTPNNLKQSVFPVGSHILPNDKGTAPGCIVEQDGKLAILLPGPPRELYPMFENAVMPFLKTRSESMLVSRYLRFFGIGESALETALKDLFDEQQNPTLATYAKPGEVMLRVTASGLTENAATELLTPVLSEVDSRVGEYLYSYDNEELEEVLIPLLKSKGLTIASAESCTGGLIASKLINVSGASSVVLGGIVAYSNSLKVEMLEVPSPLIETHGAVSEQVVQAMTEGLFARTGADFCIGTTGVAGPEGGTLDKPVGLVYLDLLYKGCHETHRLQLTGDRDRIRNQTALNALHKSILLLKKNC